MQPDAFGSFPYLLVFGFGVVWITLTTLGVIWLATWRSSRRAAAPAAAGEVVPARRGMTRRRVGRLMAVGCLGGVVIGATASAYALYTRSQQEQQRRRGGGTTGP